MLGLGQGGVGGVYRRLAEDSRDGLLEQDVVDTLDIITVDEPQTFQGLNAQQVDQLVAKALSLAVKTGLFLNINAIYHSYFLLNSGVLWGVSDKSKVLGNSLKGNNCKDEQRGRCAF